VVIQAISIPSKLTNFFGYFGMDMVWKNTFLDELVWIWLINRLTNILDIGIGWLTG
jgi:hypothetical protein